MNQKERMPKLEKITLSKEAALEKTRNLFDLIGNEKINEKDGSIIENESLKISFKRENIKFGTDNIPQNEDELLDSKLTIKERRVLRFLDFKPGAFYILNSYQIEDKHTGTKLNLKTEFPDIVIYVKKGGQDPTESAADYLENCIKTGIEPISAAGILIMLHEIGHKKDSLLAPFGSTIPQREHVSTNNADEDKLDQERFAWAYCFRKLRPYFKGLNISKEYLDTLVHQWALGTYSDAVKHVDSRA